jgi:putative hydrolase of the HAD superfamily
MMTRAALVDLGGTLVDFFGQMGHAPMVPVALRSLSDELASRGFAVPPAAVQEQSWNAKKRNPQDLRVHPLEDRLASIFDLDQNDEREIDTACRAFMRPVYQQARLFEDALPFLDELRSRNIRTILVSNTTWGSPAHLWRDEVARHGIASRLDDAVFCRDAGWRKPDKEYLTSLYQKRDALLKSAYLLGTTQSGTLRGPRQWGSARS